MFALCVGRDGRMNGVISWERAGKWGQVRWKLKFFRAHLLAYVVIRSCGIGCSTSRFNRPRLALRWIHNEVSCGKAVRSIFIHAFEVDRGGMMKAIRLVLCHGRFFTRQNQSVWIMENMHGNNRSAPSFFLIKFYMESNQIGLEFLVSRRHDRYIVTFGLGH